MRLLRAVIIR